MGQLDPDRRAGCELCMKDGGGALIMRNDKFRVIRADEADHPAFYRVIWNAHIVEWTDLPATDRFLMMSAVETVEQVLRRELKPDKINLASLGNVVPHLHWHVIARFSWDARWPAPVWAAVQRTVPMAASRLPMPLTQLDIEVATAVRSLLTSPGPAAH